MPLTKTDIVVAAIGLIVLLGGLMAYDGDAFLYEPSPVHTNSARFELGGHAMKDAR